MTNSIYGTPTPEEVKTFKNLFQDFDEASKFYLKAEKELVDEANGFFPKHLLDNITETKSKFQTASNKYHTFLSQLIEKYKSK
ncbi:hypothetical protein [Pedobacter agri]|uniref:hypothetical protein n=1 Tax=Pedobacter agri TaxID=454586 RepID=UPI00292F7F61|nr:hypothetical protein [Pedobacter agri]